MPVDLDRLERITAEVAAIYREGETALLLATRERLDRGLDLLDWQQRKLSELGAYRTAAAAIVGRIAGTGLNESRQAVAAGYRAGRADAVAELSGHNIPRPRGAAAEQAANAVQALADARVRELRPVHAAILPQAESLYRQAIARAAGRRLTGAEDMRTAAQGAWAELVARGVTGFVDRGGREWRLTSYVEMGTRAAVTRAAVVGLVDVYRSQGIRLVSVDDQAGECERCRPFEHEVLALDGGPGRRMVPHHRTGELVPVQVVATLDQARAMGLFHPNCRHTIRAYLPGVSILLKQGRTADEDGHRARTRQREIERALRYWREQRAGALTARARTRADERVATWDAAMAEHVREHKLKRLRYREQIGAGFIPPAGRVTAAARELGIPD
jgi:hypothetical protein